jgi:hypothetical protein
MACTPTLLRDSQKCAQRSCRATVYVVDEEIAEAWLDVSIPTSVLPLVRSKFSPSPTTAPSSDRAAGGRRTSCRSTAAGTGSGVLADWSTVGCGPWNQTPGDFVFR